jgi:hypothetical protein
VEGSSIASADILPVPGFSDSRRLNVVCVLLVPRTGGGTASSGTILYQDTAVALVEGGGGAYEKGGEYACVEGQMLAAWQDAADIKDAY